MNLERLTKSDIVVIWVLSSYLFICHEKDVTLPVYDGGKKYEVYSFSFVTNKTSTLDNGGYEGTIRSVVIPDYGGSG